MSDNVPVFTSLSDVYSSQGEQLIPLVLPSGVFATCKAWAEQQWFADLDHAKERFQRIQTIFKTTFNAPPELYARSPGGVT